MLNTRYLCDCCEEPLDPADMQKNCDCEDHGVLEEHQCPTCWEWRDHSEYEDSLSCCHDCRVHAKTMVRLGIVSIEETVIDVFHERVRMRNCTLHEAVPITQIRLEKGMITGEIQGARDLAIWNESMKQWQVVDNFLFLED